MNMSLIEIKKWRKTKKVIIIFILAFLVRILSVYISPIKLWDETVYANLGWDLKSNPLDYSFARKWSDYVPGDWPKAGYRAPLLPYTLAVLYSLTSSQTLIDLFIPFIGAISVIFVYILAKNLFDEKIAFYSSIFLAFLPSHVIYSGKILTDVFSTFFLIISILFFWLGFEKGKNKYKLLFGFCFALSLLARYTILWVFPIFPIYLILKCKNLSFLKDKFLWYSVAIFFFTLTPWFLYGISEYNNPAGPFLHAQRAANYWGGMQPWYFYFQYSTEIFSILFPLFVLSLAFLIISKEIGNRKVLFLLLWFLVFLIFATSVPHKEERFLLPIVPPVVILSSLLANKFKIVLNVALALMILHLIFSFNSTIIKSYTPVASCFLKANEFITQLEDNSVIVTDESPRVYFYTKKENHFYPSPFDLSSIHFLADYYKGRPIYILWSAYDMPLEIPKNKITKNILDNNFEIIYKCPEDGSLAAIYSYYKKIST